MRKDVIDTAAVDVDLIAQQRCGHRAALNVPTRTARSPGRIPFHVPVFFVPRFPEREIADVFFIVFVVLHAACLSQLREIEMGQLPVIRKFADAKID